MKVLRATVVTMALLLGVYAVGCGGDDNKNPVNPGGGGGTPDLTINISGQNGSNSFTPSNATITVGQRVAWHNNDGATHTATADNSSFNTGNISPGGTSSAIQMNTQGTFGYHCSIHSSMIDTLIVNP